MVRTWAWAAVAVSSCWLLFAATPAGATIAPTLTLPANCAQDATAPEDYFFCNDGVPPAGGLIPNASGASAVTVPAKYGGDGYSGLPASTGAPTDPGADATGNIALDVDISYPGTGSGPFPLLVFMHGCCSGSKASWESTSFDAGGELWHYNNAWFASRGYVVINYTSRGFVNGQNQGSTGQTQLDSRNFEINDFQHLACQVNDLFDSGGPALPDIDESKVVATGGSYGGGFSWMALTDPLWNCAGAGNVAVDMKLAAAAPKYGWTDLANSLVPTGRHSARAGQLPAVTGCDSGPVQADGSGCPAPQTPVGIAKRSIISGLFASGAAPGVAHTTFPPSIAQTFACAQGPDFSAQGASCPGVTTTLAEFIRERSAYYQNSYFANLAVNPNYVVPTFAAGTFTDWLFPSTEHRRMVNRLLSINPGYPIQTYYGDYQHFTQNKAKVWGDICGTGPAAHVCNNGDYGGNFDAAPAARTRQGITSRLNAFIDHYALTGTSSDLGTPSFDTTAELEVCPQNAASLGVAADEGGPQFTAPSFEQLAPNTLTVDAQGAQTTTNKAVPNSHAANSDPVANERTNVGRCPVETAQNAQGGPGVASYTSQVLPRNFTMLGGGVMRIAFAATGPVAQMNARLYDVLPNGNALLVDRGPRRLLPSEASAGQVTYELFGSGWRFPEGHRVRIELFQDDDPFLHLTETASSAALSRAVLRIPIREPSAKIDAKPTLRKGRCANKTLGTKLGERLVGSPKGDRIKGRRGRDLILGKGGKDCLSGGAAKDRVAGGSGRDKLIGGPRKDRLEAGGGRDRIFARDGRRDVVRCGKGKDRAVVDRVDSVRSCEKVRRKGRR